METVIILLFIYVVLYAVYLLRLIYGFRKVKTWNPKESKPQTAFSVVIPFRNESKNLPALLESLANLDYPKELLEYIFVDDFSDDDSARIVTKWRLENDRIHTTMLDNVRVSNSPKKDAVNRAIPIVMHNWVITTDADCIVLPTWLSALNDFILHNDVAMIAGPVVYKTRFRFLDYFQQADLMALQGATIGSFGLGKAFMGNAANFGFTKSAFLDVGGFTGNDHVASGDDVFLLQKMVSKFPENVRYVKSRNAIVTTKPSAGLIELFFQRVRWASKASSYDNEFGEMLAIIVFIGNAVLVAASALTIAELMDYRILIIMFLLKFLPDLILMCQANGFLRKGKLIFPIVSGMVYPFFSTAVGLYSFYGRYRWKGRSLR